VKRILSEIHQGDYDLVIVDANLGAEPRHRHLSARARAIVRRSPISVLVFQPAVQKIKHVLICTGGLHLSDPVIETGAQLARAFNAEVSLLHVVGAIPSMYTGLDQIEETLPELLSTDTPIAQHLRSSAEILDQYQVPSQLILRRGIVNNEIIREVSLGEYDLIVTGPPKSSHGFIRLFLGDVVEDVIEHTAIPFLIVKQPLPTSV
jgi:nucleotide-binding universal stress UspA family protein